MSKQSEFIEKAIKALEDAQDAPSDRELICDWINRWTENQPIGFQFALESIYAAINHCLEGGDYQQVKLMDFLDPTSLGSAMLANKVIGELYEEDESDLRRVQKMGADLLEAKSRLAYLHSSYSSLVRDVNRIAKNLTAAIGASEALKADPDILSVSRLAVDVADIHSGWLRSIA